MTLPVITDVGQGLITSHHIEPGCELVNTDRVLKNHVLYLSNLVTCTPLTQYIRVRTGH